MCKCRACLQRLIIVQEAIAALFIWFVAKSLQCSFSKKENAHRLRCPLAAQLLPFYLKITQNLKTIVVLNIAYFGLSNIHLPNILCSIILKC